MSKRRIRKKALKLNDRNSKIIWIRRTLVIMAIFLLIIYFILRIVYDTGRFTIVLDHAGDPMSGLVIYNKLEEKKYQQKLEAEKVDFFTNIAQSWLPENIDNEAEGSHNGTNYIAYTFYVENKSDNTMNYYYEVILDDVIRNVDEALRVMIILNGEKSIYAKVNSTTKEPEENTIAFKPDKEIIVEPRKDFKAGEIDKCTVVIWIEGNDPDCIDDLIGGEIKMHMMITEDHISSDNNNNKGDEENE